MLKKTALFLRDGFPYTVLYQINLPWFQNVPVPRFLHPGVLDKGNYSMFAAPRPILPGEPEDSKPVPKEKQVECGHI